MSEDAAWKKIDEHTKTLKLHLKDAGVIHGSSIIHRKIRTYAGDLTTDFDSWAKAAEASTGAGQNGKRWDFFEGAYVKIARAAGAAATVEQTEDSDPSSEPTSIAAHREHEAADSSHQGGAA